MMEMRRFACIALLVVNALVSTAASAQAEQLSRASVVVRALRQNPQLAAARSRQAQAEAEQTQADSARWPEITVELGVGPSLRAELAPGSGVESTRSRYELSASDLSVVVGGRLNVLQPLYTFGKIDGFRSAAAHGVRARE